MIADEDVVKALSTISEYCNTRRITPTGANMCDGCPMDKVIPGGDCSDIFAMSPYYNAEDVSDYLQDMPAQDKEENDAVNHPSHYCQGGIETIAILKAKMPAERFIGFLEGNVIKYITRAPYKGNEKQDLEKARWYLERLIKEIDETAKPYLEGMQKP